MSEIGAHESTSNSHARTHVHDVWHGGNGEGDGAVSAALLDGEERAAGGAHGQREHPGHADVAADEGWVGEMWVLGNGGWV